jgi:hypothetical protein
MPGKQHNAEINWLSREDEDILNSKLLNFFIIKNWKCYKFDFINNDKARAYRKIKFIQKLQIFDSILL